MPEWTVSYIGIGSNEGDRQGNITMAIRLLKKNKDIKFDAVSKIRETDPVGCRCPDKFLNGVLKVRTRLTPMRLLRFLNLIESRLGRVRTVRNSPRPIDLDILTFGVRSVSTLSLRIPHPRMFKRDFVLKPLREILGTKKSICTYNDLKPFL